MLSLKTVALSLVVALTESMVVSFARSTSSYDVEIPSSAVVVSNWESLYTESLYYPDTALVAKYGGWVIEKDNVVVLAVGDAFIDEITRYDPEADKEKVCEEVELVNDDGNLVKRCSHPRCFTHAHCRTYTGCHVCRVINLTTGTGKCI